MPGHPPVFNDMSSLVYDLAPSGIIAPGLLAPVITEPFTNAAGWISTGVKPGEQMGFNWLDVFIRAPNNAGGTTTYECAYSDDGVNVADEGLTGFDTIASALGPNAQNPAFQRRIYFPWFKINITNASGPSINFATTPMRMMRVAMRL